MICTKRESDPVIISLWFTSMVYYLAISELISIGLKNPLSIRGYISPSDLPRVPASAQDPDTGEKRRKDEQNRSLRGLYPGQ